MPLPLAMLSLMILTALMVAFAALSVSEPVIAGNHLLVSRARALAESGIERAVWALSSAGQPAGLEPPPAGATAPPPYDGLTYLPLAAGGLTVRVTGVAPSEVAVEAVGWSPGNDPGDPRSKAHRRLLATLVRFPRPGRDAPCVLCVAGAADARGAVSVDARTDSACGAKAGIGVYGAGATLATSGGARIHGSDGNAIPNEATDVVVGTRPAFDGFDLTPAQLALLRRWTRRHGTYLQGPQAFDAGRPLPGGGVVFVDTPGGGDPGRDPAALPTVRIHGGAAPPGGFTGWIVVLGHLELDGDHGTLRGFLYAAGTLVAAGTEAARVEGVAVARQLGGGQSRLAGAAALSLACRPADGDGVVPAAWQVAAGSYQEIAD